MAKSVVITRKNGGWSMRETDAVLGLIGCGQLVIKGRTIIFDPEVPFIDLCIALKHKSFRYRRVPLRP